MAPHLALPDASDLSFVDLRPKSLGTGPTLSVLSWLVAVGVDAAVLAHSKSILYFKKHLATERSLPFASFSPNHPLFFDVICLPDWEVLF